MAERELGRIATLRDRAGRVIVLRETSGADAPDASAADRTVSGPGSVPVFRLPGALQRHLKRLREARALMRVSSVPVLGKVAYLSDPDGNRAWVHEPPTGRGGKPDPEFGPPPSAPELSCVLVLVAGGEAALARALRFYTEGLGATLQKKGAWHLLQLSNLRVLL